MGPSGQFRLTSSMFKGNSQQNLRYPETSGHQALLSGPISPRPINKEKAWARQLSLAWPPSCNPLATVPALSLDGWGTFTQTHVVGSSRWLGMLLGPMQRDSGVPSLGLGWGFLSFLGSVDMLHFVSRLLGLSPCSAKAPLFPTDGLSCSFIRGVLPWAHIHPVCIPERPLLFLLLPAPLLPFWPCCQRPLVLGWLRWRAWPLKASQVLGSLWGSVGGSS